MLRKIKFFLKKIKYIWDNAGKEEAEKEYGKKVIVGGEGTIVVLGLREHLYRKQLVTGNKQILAKFLKGDIREKIFQKNKFKINDEEKKIFVKITNVKDKRLYIIKEIKALHYMQNQWIVHYK